MTYEKDEDNTVQAAQHNQETENEAVGYKRPPRHSRFVAGKSGNPRGRPKGSKNLDTIYKDVLARTVAVQTESGRKRIPLLEAILLATGQKALKGDTNATKLMLDLKQRMVEATSTESLTPTRQDDESIIDAFLKRQQQADLEKKEHDE
jgi:hypothetical protein